MGHRTNIEELIYLDSYLIDKILDIIFINNENDRDKYNIKYNDVYFINLLFSYINKYNGDNIKKDIYDKFNNYSKDYELSFYIYFIFCYFKLMEEKYIFSLKFYNNISILIYDSDIEALYNRDKFKMHYQDNSFRDIDLSNDVSDSLREYIKNNIPANIDGYLEIAIAIYILLCSKLRYDPLYVIIDDDSKIIPYNKITLKDNKVVCIQFAIIYYKLLKEYGIDANLVGDMNTHMYVSLSIGTLSIVADSTRYGYYTDQLTLSDLTNLKHGFMIDGFFISSKAYSDIGYVKYAKNRLNKRIIEVYHKIGLDSTLKDKLEHFIDKYQQVFLTKRFVNKKEFDERINILNEYFRFSQNNVENIQFYNYLIGAFFYDIAEERLENILLYKKDSGYDIQLGKLLVLYDEEMSPHYYLFYQGKIVSYDIDKLISIILEEGWQFKNVVNIEALYLEDDEVIKKIMR